MSKDISARLGENLKKRENELVDFTSKLIRFDTSNPPGYTDEILHFIHEHLYEIPGVTIEQFEKIDRKPGLIASLDCGDGPTVVLLGHLDVVPVDEENWSFPAFEGFVEDGYIHGRGTSDMKGGVAALIFAFEELAKFKDELSGTIKLILVPDEETDGEAGIEYLNDRSDDPLNCDACLIGEPSTSHHPTIGQKGTFWMELEAVGDSEHGALHPWVGRNAIMELCQVIDKLSSVTELESETNKRLEKVIEETVKHRTRFKKDFDPSTPFRRVSFNPGEIEGGSKINIVPEKAKAEIDMRIPIGLKMEKVEEFVKDVLKDSFVDMKLIKKSYPNITWPEDDFIQSLVKQIEQTLEDRKPVVPVLQYASSDARIFREKEIPTVQYGPAELEGIHGRDEKVAIKDLVNSSIIYGKTVMDYLSGEEEDDR
ncbi:MAG: M20 family metallopeptidase [Thermoplasmatota archaeon]